ncbi:hypothetical protein ADEAN_000171900 [Angomonas deanei]|uniref:Uncharacterized protein n=1 Tax=Angomonas deanei TaxID=59799 RepID=A0A7G2C557_9TRYP|nr:hypothetical protein ADEAN_000171900 [Angomonas deanei]
MPPSRKDTPVTSPIPQSSVTLVEPPQPLSRSGTPTIVIGRRPGSGSDEIKVPDVISRSSPPGSGYRVELSEALGNSAFTIHSSTRSNSVGDNESPIGHSPMRGQGGKFQFPHTSYDGTDVEASGGTLRGSGGVGIAPNVMVYPPPHLVINHDTERGDGGENSRIYLSVSALSKGNLHPSVDTATVLSPTVDSVSVNHTDSTISGRRSIRSPPPSLTGTRIRLLQRVGRAYVARRDMPRKSRKPLGNFKRPQPILRPHFSFSAPPDLDEDSALLTGPVAPKPTAVVIKPPPLTAFSAPSKPTRRPSFEQDMNSSENGGSSYRPKSPVSVSGTICFTTSMAEASPLVASFVNKSIHALQSVSLHERVSSVVDNSVSSHLTKTFKNAAASIRRTRPNTPDIRANGEAAEVLCRMWLGFVARQRLAKIRQERQEEMALDAQLNNFGEGTIRSAKLETDAPQFSASVCPRKEGQ